MGQFQVMVIKRIIYIGEENGSAIYYDTKSNTPLKADKSKLLNTQKSKNNYRYIIFIVISLFLLKGLGVLFPTIDPFTGKYTVATILFLLSLWCGEVVFFTMLVYKALYKNVNTSTLANKKEFGYAIKNNNIWNIFKDKRVTNGKKMGAFLLIVSVLILTLGTAPMIYAINEQEKILGSSIGCEVIVISLMGLMPFLCILLLWLNNPLRWLGVAEKYQNKLIKYGEKDEK